MIRCACGQVELEPGRTWMGRASRGDTYIAHASFKCGTLGTEAQLKKLLKAPGLDAECKELVKELLTRKAQA